ncbi:uncharacterized protein BDZ99DRAFT_464186 [Mytilinidion resinicola]|uniref:DUF7924 domain-containing protein n=1 Tax=Mytilinidion resinicola TaxID=574789 RepID=A0A6A6YHN5_9PEZI|nr:uncharacterized protein BDZ99DRAFT_464186 [Mytilinidion resinicola]KAF2808311.1 hypothetical protein BDZ99DRAFT_464186 [Mytilinidion resinicola]
MAPQAKSAPAKKNRRKTAAGPATPIVRSVKPRKSARLQNDSTPSTRPAPISQPACARRKRSRDPEAEADDREGVCPEAEADPSVHPAKRPRSLPSPQLQLSETNLRRFNGEEMHITPASRIKRSSSQRSTSSDVTQDTARSQRSSGTTAYYRFAHLATAQVYIHTDSAEDIQEAIDAVFKAEPSEERRDQLKAISQVLHNGCTKAARAAVGEDDFVHLFFAALKAMSSEKLCLREKADWQEVLKPRIQRSHFNLDFLAGFDFMAGYQQQEVDATATPRKRHQESAGQTYISPRSSMANAFDPMPAKEPGTMPPPAPPSVLEADRSPIKTPRPDISIGTEVTALTSALSSQDTNSSEAWLFLTQLQNMMVHRESGGPQEPVLISVPAPRASDLAFPFAVVEGKAYSTGKQVFEAENQAAVAGACGLKMQLCLDELVERAAPTPTSDVLPAPKNQPALFFSICTQGPIHELWVHWTNVEGGMRKFHMKLLKICHGVLLEGVEDFIVAVDNMLRWGTGQFLESVVERLGRVARNTRAEA